MIDEPETAHDRIEDHPAYIRQKAEDDKLKRQFLHRTAHVDRLKADVLWEILADMGGYSGEFGTAKYEYVMSDPDSVAKLARAVDAIQAWKFGSVPT